MSLLFIALFGIVSNVLALQENMNLSGAHNIYGVRSSRPTWIDWQIQKRKAKKAVALPSSIFLLNINEMILFLIYFFNWIVSGEEMAVVDAAAKEMHG